jgi:hypothetical protein
MDDIDQKEAQEDWNENVLCGVVFTSSWGGQVVHPSWKWKLYQDRRPSTTTHGPTAFETKEL